MKNYDKRFKNIIQPPYLSLKKLNLLDYSFFTYKLSVNIKDLRNNLHDYPIPFEGGRTAFTRSPGT